MSIITDLKKLKIIPKSHPPHYLLHKYWGRKPHNLIAEYISLFTKSGDQVLDPFMGSGGVVIESNKLNRVGFGIDLNPMACNIVKETLKMKVDEVLLEKTFESIIDSIPSEIIDLAKAKHDDGIEYNLDNAVWDLDQIKTVKYYKNKQKVTRKINKSDLKKVVNSNKLLKKYVNKGLAYPKQKIIKYVRRNGKEYINELFSDRNLLIAAFIIQEINKVKDVEIKNSLLFIFTSALPNFSKMIPGDIDKVTGKSGWQISKFWAPSVHTEKNVISSIRLRLKKYIKGKNDIQPLITNTKYFIFNNSCEDMANIKDKSIDYIFTDPPYGDSISYFALSSFWSSWLNLEVDYEGEIIYDPYRDKKEEDYSTRLNNAFKEIHRVLKDNKYMSFTFHNRHMKFWKIIIDACKSAGFEIINVKWVDQAVSSGTQGINRKNTLKGDFVYTFKKVYSTPISLSKNNGEKLIIQITKKLIKQYGSVSAAILYENLIPEIISKNSYYNSNNKIIDIEKFLSNNFEYSIDQKGNYGWKL